MLLKDKTAVVTGCNKGIGKKILETFNKDRLIIITFLEIFFLDAKSYSHKL